MEKGKEENIWRGKMSPWRDKKRTRKDLDFFLVKFFLGENFFWWKFFLVKFFLGGHFLGEW